MLPFTSSLICSELLKFHVSMPSSPFKDQGVNRVGTKKTGATSTFFFFSTVQGHERLQVVDTNTSALEHSKKLKEMTSRRKIINQLMRGDDDSNPSTVAAPPDRVLLLVLVSSDPREQGTRPTNKSLLYKQTQTAVNRSGETIFMS